MAKISGGRLQDHWSSSYQRVVSELKIQDLEETDISQTILDLGQEMGYEISTSQMQHDAAD